ncbi:MAG: Fe-S cluster assembly protein SufD [Xanthomonadales bacterium]|nr:Fe-S cluster assembly protein SufD [Xanthomonadales bacterium]
MSELSAQLAAALPDNNGVHPEWLKKIRETGAEQFRTHGLPTRKSEAWKYTGLVSLDQTGLTLASGIELPVSGSAQPSPLVDSAIQLNLLDGRLVAQIGDVPAGLTILPLADALENGVKGLQVLLESLSDDHSKGAPGHGFSALNSATLDPGVVVHVARGTDAGSMSLLWSNSPDGKSHLFNSRICVILEEGARLELLEQFESTGDNSNTSNIIMQAELGKEARLRHIRFQQETEKTALITRTEISQRADSEYAYFGFDLGGGLVRHDLHTSLLGSGAKSAINGAYLLDGNRHVDNHTRVDHIAPGGYSDQYFRGVAGGSGRAVFNTAVCVHPGADETEARQSNANILLSARAEIDTKPELEIYADEVVASHGATVGQLDELAVFYMRSRGLTEQEARQLLTTAFCQSVSDKLDDPVLGGVISQRMMDVMPQAE